MAENHTDAMIERLNKEIAERDAYIQGSVANAQDTERDLTSNEKELITEARKRIEVCEEQLENLYAARERTAHARKRSDEVQKELTLMRNQVDHAGEIEYRSAGAYLIDAYQASLGSRDAQQRLENFSRAAAHQKTTDNAGVVPDPIVGSVINFIDAARPMVTAIGPEPLTAGTFYRPRVTQHTVVDVQGTAGAAADEKAELDSQKMTITRLTATAKTYGGYVNVSRQNIDFSSPQIMDIIIDDLAAQYAIKTEAAVGIELTASTTTAVGYGASPTAVTVAAAIWTAAGTAYGVTKGQGRVILAIAPDRLGVFGPLFVPVNPQNAQSTGFVASGFGQGALGSIAGIPVVVSAGLTTGQAFLFSTAAIEVYEQRVGTLQAVEPSVLGVQVAYAGYFTALTIDDDAIIELTAS